MKKLLALALILELSFPVIACPPLSVGSPTCETGVVTNWAPYTPTFVGLGTVSNVSFYWKEIGDTIFVKGFVTTGNLTASAMAMSLPNATLINSNKAAANFRFGLAARVLAGASPGISNEISIFYDGADASNVYFAHQNYSQSSSFIKDSGNALFLNGDSISITFDYPI